MGVAEYILTKDLPNELQGRLPNLTEMKSKILPSLGTKD
jgi:hypothetical protein